jgi:lysophospholipase L1-like esterase
MERKYVIIFSLLLFYCGFLLGEYEPSFDRQFAPEAKNKEVGKSEKTQARTALYDLQMAALVRPYYKHKVDFFRVNSLPKYDVVFVGDSISDSAEWEDFFPGYRIANRGINGDISFGVLNRIDSIIRTKAKTSFIMIGVNDIGRGIPYSTIYKNYVEIIEALEFGGMEVVVQSVLLTDNVIRSNHIIERLNSDLKEYCIKESIDFVDLNKDLSEEGFLRRDLSFDGLHLNGKGYRLWADAIRKYFP